MHYEDIAAVVSDAPMEVLDATRENVLAHERVNEAVMRYQTVIPMSFGTVFKTRDDIVELLRGAHGAFQDVLAKMENKVEFGLKVLWDREAMIRQIEHEDEDIRRLKTEIAVAEGLDLLRPRAVRPPGGRRAAEPLRAVRRRDLRGAARRVGGLAGQQADRRQDDPQRRLPGRPRRARPGFDARVKALGAKYDKLTFRYTGPWPPYNFVNIRLKLERAK